MPDCFAGQSFGSGRATFWTYFAVILFKPHHLMKSWAENFVVCTLDELMCTTG